MSTSATIGADMCIPRAFPDPNGDFVAPARVFQPKASRSTSASSRRRYTTSERSPRHSGAYTVPPPPQQTAILETRSPRKSHLEVPPPVIVQERAPRPAHADSGFVLPPPDHTEDFVRQPSPDHPPSLTHQTSIRRPRTSSSRGSVPPHVPEAPPAVREEHHHYHHYHHYRDHSHTSSDSTRGRSSTRHSSASRSTRTPLSARFPGRTNSTSGRSDRYSTAISEPEAQRLRKPDDNLTPELPKRSISTRTPRYLEQPRHRDPIVIQNQDGSRVRRYYYA